MDADWSVRPNVYPPHDPAGDAVEDALFDLMLVAGERILDLAASADRSGRLQELATLTADLDLFARTAVKAADYR